MVALQPVDLLFAHLAPQIVGTIDRAHLHHHHPLLHQTIDPVSDGSVAAKAARDVHRCMFIAARDLDIGAGGWH
jgi:hypothetical protein